jgi:cell wall-associated NlpC family hydrolase
MPPLKKPKFQPYKSYHVNAHTFDNFRLVGYGDDGIYDLTEAVNDLTWTDSLEQAAVQGTVSVWDPKRKYAFLRKGSRLQLSFREPYGSPNGQWKELDRFVIWDKTRHSRNDPLLYFTFYDMLIYTMETEDSFLFQKDKTHKKGWTAADITRWICDKYQIKLGRIPKAKRYIPYLNIETGTIYDLLLKAWTYEREESGLKYVIRAVHDKLYVFPKQPTDIMWELSDDTNLLDAEWVDSMQGMATALTVIGTQEQATTSSNPQPGTQPTTPTTQPDIRVTVQQRAKIKRYGYIHKVLRLEGISDKKTALKMARNSLLTTARENQDGRVTAFLVPDLRAGDPIYVKDTAAALVGQFWCSSVQHQINAGGAITDVGLNWMDVVPSMNFDESELHPPTSPYSGTTTGAASGEAGAVIAKARTALGVPYVWGGGNSSGPTGGVSGGPRFADVGFDCSGLTLYAYSAVGISLDHYTDSQYAAGEPVPMSQLQPGDLVFYGRSASQSAQFSHVAMVTNPQGPVVIEAAASAQKVVEHVRTGWIAACRFPQLAQTAAPGTPATTGPLTAVGQARTVVASTYGWDFAAEGLDRKTANGEYFNEMDLTAAMWDVPFNTLVQVTYQGKTVVVRINDRGPAAWTGATIDLSKGAAIALGFGYNKASVTIQIVRSGSG